MNNFRLAGFGKRFLAYILDGIILSIAFFLILIPFGGILAFLGLSGDAFRGGDISGSEAAALAASGVSILAIVLLLIIAPVVYDALMTASPRQGTLGKSIMRIKVVKQNGEPLSTGDAFIRALVKYVTAQFCCILLLMVCLFNKEEQNLHDMAAKTFVIEE